MTDERTAVEEAVRAYLQSAAEGRAPAEQSTGPLAAWWDLIGAVDPDTVSGGSDSLSIERLEVERIDGDGAVVELDAHLELPPAEGPRGLGRDHVEFAGPVELERTAAGWRVSDIVVQGRSAAGSVCLDAAGGQQAGGVEIAVEAVRLAGDGTTLIVRLRNDAGEEGRVTRALLARSPAGKRRTFSGAGWNTAEVPPGESRIAFYGWPVPPETGSLWLLVALAGAGGPLAFDVPIRLDGVAPTAAPAPARLPLRARLFPWLNRWTLMLVAMVVAGAVVALINPRIGGVYGLAGATIVLYQLRNLMGRWGRPAALLVPTLIAAVLLLLIGLAAIVQTVTS